jgi:hypothetical protein
LGNLSAIRILPVAIRQSSQPSDDDADPLLKFDIPEEEKKRVISALPKNILYKAYVLMKPFCIKKLAFKPDKKLVESLNVDTVINSFNKFLSTHGVTPENLDNDIKPLAVDPPITTYDKQQQLHASVYIYAICYALNIRLHEFNARKFREMGDTAVSLTDARTKFEIAQNIKQFINELHHYFNETSRDSLFQDVNTVYSVIKSINRVTFESYTSSQGGGGVVQKGGRELGDYDFYFGFLGCTVFNEGLAVQLDTSHIELDRTVSVRNIRRWLRSKIDKNKSMCSSVLSLGRKKPLKETRDIQKIYENAAFSAMTHSVDHRARRPIARGTRIKMNPLRETLDDCHRQFIALYHAFEHSKATIVPILKVICIARFNDLLLPLLALVQVVKEMEPKRKEFFEETPTVYIYPSQVVTAYIKTLCTIRKKYTELSKVVCDILDLFVKDDSGSIRDLNSIVEFFSTVQQYLMQISYQLWGVTDKQDCNLDKDCIASYEYTDDPDFKEENIHALHYGIFGTLYKMRFCFISPI